MTFDEFQEFLTERSDRDVLEAVYETIENDPLTRLGEADAHIRNGGLFYFYANGGFEATEVIALFKEIKLNRFADILQRSLDLFPGGVQAIRTTEKYPIDDRIEKLVGGRKVFYELDDEYFAHTDEIEHGFAEHVRNNAKTYYRFEEN